MAKIITADNFPGQRIMFNGNGYHSGTSVNTKYSLYFGNFGMTTSTSNNRFYAYSPIIMPFDGIVEKIIVKNVQYSSYTSGPSASGNARIQLSQHDSTYAPMDYDSGSVAYTAAANVSMTFTPNQAYSEGDYFRVFWAADGSWRYMAWAVVLQETS
jgi:hypothetical protein